MSEQTKAKTAEEIIAEDSFKGTTGPWQVVDTYQNYKEGSGIIIWDGDEQASGPICDMGELGDMNYGKALADAQLIAAAPDLLEICKSLEAEKTHLQRHFESDQKYIKSLEKTVADYYGFIHTFIESPENVLLAKVRNLEAQNKELREALNEAKSFTYWFIDDDRSMIREKANNIVQVIEQALKEDKP